MKGGLCLKRLGANYSSTSQRHQSFQVTKNAAHSARYQPLLASVGMDAPPWLASQGESTWYL
jgi:hypothetical protein